MIFNVSCEKAGRSGRSGDAVWDAVGLSPPTGPRNRLHSTKKLARIANGTAGQCTSQGVRVERISNKTTTEGLGSGSTFYLKELDRLAILL